ncbi:MAG: hypothetical protein P4L33_02905 [Capsulimonadaceae bacterium]|nr:hypothetical protein [Capsulimonadaceae bacterium]
MPLNVLIIVLKAAAPSEHVRNAINASMRQLLQADDHWEIGGVERVGDANGWDLAVVWDPVGWHAAARPLAETRIPCFAMTHRLVFHPYFAAFMREVDERGGRLLPAGEPGEIAASIDAVRAAQSLSETRLLVIDDNEGNERAEQVARFSRNSRERLGVEIERRPVAELLDLAAKQPVAAVEEEWRRWLDRLLVDAGEMSIEHMMQVVRLYLAERQMLSDCGAHGVTVDDIGAFLLAKANRVMPNVTYGLLASDGFLACEEGDIEVLTTEAILRAGLGAHPAMSNIYMAYRDELANLEPGAHYTADLERKDFLQCLADNHLVASHFSTAGVLPPNMMREERYRVVETLPSWPGQCMTSSTPRQGPVVLGRLAPDASRVHLVSGEVDECHNDERISWYRGRWMIRVPSAKGFTENCLHHHYAIGPENGRSAVLDTLTGRILGLGRFDAGNFRAGG